MPRILACTDGSIYAASVYDHAAWAALRIGAQVDIVHVLGRRQGPSAPTNLIKHHAVETLNEPIGCGGVPVYPGDIVVGDLEGVVIIPRHMADDVARDAFEQEQQEEFIISEVRSCKPLRGTYPPNAEAKARYAEWRKAKDGG